MKPLTLNQRKALAKIGHSYHSDKLVNDSDEVVRYLAKNKLKELKNE